jgi:hypothetical protein
MNTNSQFDCLTADANKAIDVLAGEIIRTLGVIRHPALSPEEQQREFNHAINVMRSLLGFVKELP